MEYKVIKAFKDKENDNIRYNVGDLFPKDGNKATKKRIEELSKKHSEHNVSFIAPVIAGGEETTETDEEKAAREAKEDEEREAIKTELETLEVSFHPNTGLEKLKEKLEEAKAEKNKE